MKLSLLSPKQWPYSTVGIPKIRRWCDTRFPLPYTGIFRAIGAKSFQHLIISDRSSFRNCYVFRNFIRSKSLRTSHRPCLARGPRGCRHLSGPLLECFVSRAGRHSPGASPVENDRNKSTMVWCFTWRQQKLGLQRCHRPLLFASNFRVSLLEEHKVCVNDVLVCFTLGKAAEKTHHSVIFLFCSAANYQHSQTKHQLLTNSFCQFLKFAPKFWPKKKNPKRERHLLKLCKRQTSLKFFWKKSDSRRIQHDDACPFAEKLLRITFTITTLI